MPVAARHRNDPVPLIEALPCLIVRRERDAAVVATLQSRTEALSRFISPRKPSAPRTPFSERPDILRGAP